MPLAAHQPRRLNLPEEVDDLNWRVPARRDCLQPTWPKR
jgi:hypothetical protein